MFTLCPPWDVGTLNPEPFNNIRLADGFSLQMRLTKAVPKTCCYMD